MLVIKNPILRKNQLFIALLNNNSSIIGYYDSKDDDNIIATNVYRYAINTDINVLWYSVPIPGIDPRKFVSINTSTIVMLSSPNEELANDFLRFLEN